MKTKLRREIKNYKKNKKNKRKENPLSHKKVHKMIQYKKHMNRNNE